MGSFNKLSYEEDWHVGMVAEKLNQLVSDLNEKTGSNLQVVFNPHSDWIQGRMYLPYSLLTKHLKDSYGFVDEFGEMGSYSDWHQNQIQSRVNKLGEYVSQLEGVASLFLFTAQPQGSTVDEYSLATFSCEVMGGVAPYTYLWRENGADAGSNSSTLSFAAGVYDRDAEITVTVTDSAGAVITSTPVVLGVTSYSYRYDGVTNYALLSQENSIGANTDFEIELYTHVFTNSKKKFIGTNSAAKSGLFGWEDDGSFVLRIDGSWRLSTGAIAQTAGRHKINLKRSGGVFSVTVNDGTPRQWAGVYNSIFYTGLVARAFGSSFYEHLDGYAEKLKIWTGGDRSTGTLSLSIPLNNKSQGASQLATVGSINATIINYNAAGWTVI